MRDRVRRPATPPLKHFVKFRVRYSIGKPRGFGPRGNVLSSAAISFLLSVRFAAAALSAACSSLEAFGIANTEAWRVRKLKTTWRGDAPCASAMVCNACPGLLRGIDLHFESARAAKDQNNCAVQTARRHSPHGLACPEDHQGRARQHRGRPTRQGQCSKTYGIDRCPPGG